ncbi:MAG: hypothetical protein A2V88_11940 [Elusimicrobia bacterium RBG_16_66_12]|nr:MAG: hypothetical protein A2V88_11940 [Elusimicrobia bacterium RBG_16_66_12]
MIENEPDPLRRIPVKHAAEIRAEIGAVLRAERLKRGLSLEAVAAQTRISKRFLEAMENDRFEEFPAVVYLRGFLKGYCEHLDLDFPALWEKIEASSKPAADAASPVPAADGKGAAPSRPEAPHASRAHASAAHAPPEERSRETSSTALLMVVFAVAAAVGLGIWLAEDRKPRETASDDATPRVLMPMAHAVAPKLTLRATDDVWVRVAVDDAVVFEGRMPRGAAMDWKPTKTVALRTTSASALSVSLNDAPAPMPAPTPDGDYRFDLP